MLAELGFIGTIGEDDEVPVEPESDSGDDEEEVGAGGRIGGGGSRERERPGRSCGRQAVLSVLRCPQEGCLTQAVQRRPPPPKSVLLPAHSGMLCSHLSIQPPRQQSWHWAVGM